MLAATRLNPLPTCLRIRNDVATKSGLSEFATKADLAKLESKIAKLESKIVELEMRLTWRMIITVGIFNSMLFLALKFTG